jgi:hypothetical protein
VCGICIHDLGLSLAALRDSLYVPPILLGLAMVLPMFAVGCGNGVVVVVHSSILRYYFSCS